MDENYLDNLLNEFSLDKEIDNKIEDELDAQIENEKNQFMEGQTVSREESFNYDLEQDAMGGMPESDIDFSEDQIDELDRLDNLADVDMSDLDFSDIDFDDLDITKLDDINDSDFDDLLKSFDGDLEIPSFEEEFSNSSEKAESDTESFDSSDTYSEETVDAGIEQQGDLAEQVTEEQMSQQSEADFGAPENAEGPVAEQTNDLNEDNFDADSFLDSLLSEDSIEESGAKDVSAEGNDSKTGDAEAEAVAETAAEDDDNNSLDDLLGGDEAGDTSGEAMPIEEAAPDGGDLSEEDLFSMLDMEENGGEPRQAAPAAEADGEDSSLGSDIDMSALEGLDDIEDISEKPKKKKRSFMEILFGPPDEDDEPTEEELQAIAEKKAAKKAKKEAAKEKKKEEAEKNKEEKSKKDADKKKQDDEKKRVKAEKKAQRKAEEKAEAAKEKKLNKPMVIFIFSVLLGGVGFMYLSSVDFNYKLAIQHAANYFASQKYHKAYDEIKGVEVKEKDQELKDRIYTVMYVERLYESYENNIELGRNKKALDSLLRGVSKYYEYYDDAQELDIVSDLDFSFSQIQNALQMNYGISLERALEINELDDYEYMKTVSEYTDDQSEE